MSDFFDDNTQRKNQISFLKSKASLLEDLADNGNVNLLSQELNHIETLTSYEMKFLRNYLGFNFAELNAICKLNNRLNNVNTSNIGSLQDLVNAYGELETVELDGSYITAESKRQRIDERRNVIKNDLSKVSQRVVKDTLIDLYYLAENNDLEKFYDLKDEYKFLIGSVYTSNHFLDTFSSRVNEIEINLGLNSFYENLFKNVFNVIRKAKTCFENESYHDGFTYLNNVENYLITNNYMQFYYMIDEFKDDLIDKHVSIHLSNGFSYAEKHDELRMNDELSKVKILLDYNDIKDKNIKIIETLCYKESLPWIVDEFQKETSKSNPDVKYIKQLSSNFKRYTENLKSNYEDCLFAEKHKRKLSYLCRDLNDDLKKYVV